MNKKPKILIIFFLWFQILVLIHEHLHQVIFREYGINSTIHTWFLYGQCIPEDYVLDPASYNSMTLAHLNLEIATMVVLLLGILYISIQMIK